MNKIKKLYSSYKNDKNIFFYVNHLILTILMLSIPFPYDLPFTISIFINLFYFINSQAPYILFTNRKNIYYRIGFDISIPYIKLDDSFIKKDEKNKIYYINQKEIRTKIGGNIRFLHEYSDKLKYRVIDTDEPIYLKKSRSNKLNTILKKLK
jgi:hypothetical protein